MKPFEHENGVTIRSSNGRSTTMKCLIILSVVSFILLVISIVFITLYALERSERSKATSEPQSDSKPQKYCGSKSCFFTAQGKIKCNTRR